jgi:hypothetical protein
MGELNLRKDLQDNRKSDLRDDPLQSASGGGVSLPPRVADSASTSRME